jgi:hypothetical protein
MINTPGAYICVAAIEALKRGRNNMRTQHQQDKGNSLMQIVLKIRNCDKGEKVECSCMRSTSSRQHDKMQLRQIESCC